MNPSFYGLLAEFRRNNPDATSTFAWTHFRVLAVCGLYPTLEVSGESLIYVEGQKTRSTIYESFRRTYARTARHACQSVAMNTHQKVVHLVTVGQFDAAISSFMALEPAGEVMAKATRIGPGWYRLDHYHARSGELLDSREMAAPELAYLAAASLKEHLQ
jgi:hypothetical protein